MQYAKVIGSTRFLVRANAQYGTQGKLVIVEGESEQFIDFYEGTGLGIGIGYRFSTSLWIVADAWAGIDGSPDGWQHPGFDPHGSIGIVLGDW
jgi:hypothetical protein